MPIVRKMTEQEVQQLNNKSEGKGQRKLVEEEYDAILSEYDEGDYGEVTLDPTDVRLTVRNRLIAAARRRDLSIDFRRTNGNILRFKIVPKGNGTADVPAAAPAPEPEPVKRKGGRPKKTA